eukprot:3169014-Prymnesium_polylepis.1
MLIHHSNLAAHAMSSAVPNAPFVTIVRDPADTFMSAWDNYYGDDHQLRSFDVVTDANGVRSNATLHLGHGLVE